MKIKYPELPEGYAWNTLIHETFIAIVYTPSFKFALCATQYVSKNKRRWYVYRYNSNIKADNLTKQQAVNFMANCVNLGMIERNKS